MLSSVSRSLYEYYLDSSLPNSESVGEFWDMLIHKFPKFARRFFPSLNDDFELRSYDGRTTVLSDSRSTVGLKNNYARILLREWRDWLASYLVDVKGKVVLDVGAGCGETCVLWFENGAEKVIAVEPDEECCRLLKLNASVNNWDVDIVNDYFAAGYLDYPHDFLKIDCEGGEIVLLEDRARSLGRCRMEMHPKVIGEMNVGRIIGKFDLKHISGNIWGS